MAFVDPARVKLARRGSLSITTDGQIIISFHNHEDAGSGTLPDIYTRTTPKSASGASSVTSPTSAKRSSPHSSIDLAANTQMVPLQDNFYVRSGDFYYRLDLDSELATVGRVRREISHWLTCVDTCTTMNALVQSKSDTMRRHLPTLNRPTIELLVFTGSFRMRLPVYACQLQVLKK
jgi:hypothetical protein